MIKLFHPPVSILTRLVVLIGATLSLALLLFSWIMINSVVLHFKQQDEYTLSQINLTISSLLSENSDPQNEQFLRIKTILNEHQDIAVYLSDNQGNTLVSPNTNEDIIEALKNYNAEKNNHEQYLENYRIAEKHI